MVDDRVNRIYTLKNIILKDEDKEYPATITDFSVKGISIMTEKILPTYKMVKLILILNGKTVILEGSVRWIHENKKETKPRFNEIGLALLNPPIEYLEYIKKIDK